MMMRYKINSLGRWLFCGYTCATGKCYSNVVPFASRIKSKQDKNASVNTLERWYTKNERYTCVHCIIMLMFFPVFNVNFNEIQTAARTFQTGVTLIFQSTK